MYVGKVSNLDACLDRLSNPVDIDSVCGHINEKFGNEDDSHFGPGRIVLKIDGEGEVIIYTDFGRDITYGLLYYLVNRERS